MDDKDGYGKDGYGIQRWMTRIDMGYRWMTKTDMGRMDMGYRDG